MKRLSVILLISFLSTGALAGDRYSLSLLGVYGYNETYRHMGGLDVNAFLPINRFFELDTALEYQSPKTFAVSAFARPKFPLSVGELFLEGAANFRCWGNNSTGTFTAAGSLGYRMDYVSVQMGLSTMVLMDLQRKWGSESENVTEPFNFLFRLAFNVRPSTSPWNINFGVSNYTAYQFERQWQFIFFLGGHYDINESVSVLLESDLKPAGIFHMNTRFWGANVRAGIKYRF